MKDFSSLGLSELALKALPELGIYKPTEIQQKAIPILLEKPTDFIGLAQTGTGKTAAFGLPLLDYVDPQNRHTQALILSPTRELCQQIAQQLIAFSEYMPKIRCLAVYGGASITAQMRALKQPTHIVIATPGRLIDLIKRKVVKVDQIKTLVLDEADEMLNMGFKDELDEILSHIKGEKNTWLFSATMAKEIKRIIKKYMDPNAPEVVINAGQIVNENIEHQYVKVRTSEKTDIIKRFLDADPNIKGIIFCRTKLGAQSLAEELDKANYQADALHGDLSQGQRDRVMRRFKAHSLKVIVATDVAARGIDVNDLTHIFHHNLPDDFEYYTHRSGRTARAGKKGISLVLVSGRDMNKLTMIEKRLKLKFRQAQVPSEATIQADRATRWAKRILEIDLSEELDENLVNDVLKHFEETSKEDLIKKIVVNELGEGALKRKPKKKEREVRDDRNDREERGGNRKREREKGRDRDRGREREREQPADFNDRKQERQPSIEGMERFFINVGRIDEVKKKDLIEFLSDQLNVSKTNFGEVDILERCSFFEMDNQFANKIGPAFKEFEVNGRKLRVNRDSDGPPKFKTSDKPRKRKRRSKD